MAEFKCPSESCLVHREVIFRIEALEREIQSLQGNLKDKVDVERLEQTLRQLEDMKSQIGKLSEADIKFSEAVAGISATLAEFKDINKGMRDDYNKLSDAYVSTSNSISELMGILKGQNEVKQLEIQEDAKLPWYMKLLKLKPVTYIAIGVIVFVCGMVFFNWNDVVEILKLLATQPPVK